MKETFHPNMYLPIKEKLLQGTWNDLHCILVLMVSTLSLFNNLYQNQAWILKMEIKLQKWMLNRKIREKVIMLNL